MKLEILPPGQAATINIPNAILGKGSIIKTSKKVIAGNKMNWLVNPTINAFGFDHKGLKSEIVISKATPNITKPKTRFITHSEPESKLIRTLSKILSVKNLGNF